MLYCSDSYEAGLAAEPLLRWADRENEQSAIMSDHVLMFFGVRFDVSSEQQVGALELGTDPHLRAARRAKLESWWGRVTDGGSHFVLIGKKLGDFGASDAHNAQFSEQELVDIASSTREALHAAGIPGEAKFHVQLECDY